MRKGRFSCYLLGFVALAGLAREYEGTSRNQLDRNRIRGVCLNHRLLAKAEPKNCQPWLDAAAELSVQSLEDRIRADCYRCLEQYLAVLVCWRLRATTRLVRVSRVLSNSKTGPILDVSYLRS